MIGNELFGSSAREWNYKINADLNCDGLTNMADLSVLNSQYTALDITPESATKSKIIYDMTGMAYLNNDGMINLKDFSIMSQQFGKK